jgi:tetratricopeptide (TPR) repeat protein
MARASSRSFVDYYAALGCSQQASKAELKRAYAERIRIVHPDKVPKSVGSLGHSITQVLTGAWEVLQNPAQREAYDRVWLRETEQTATESRRAGNRSYLLERDSDAWELPTTPASEDPCEKYRDAISRYSEVIETAPHDERLYCNRALCQAHLGNWPACLEDARRATEIRQDCSKAWLMITMSLWRQGLEEDALSHLDISLKIMPNDVALQALLVAMREDLRADSIESAEADAPLSLPPLFTTPRAVPHTSALNDATVSKSAVLRFWRQQFPPPSPPRTRTPPPIRVTRQWLKYSSARSCTAPRWRNPKRELPPDKAGGRIGSKFIIVGAVGEPPCPTQLWAHAVGRCKLSPMN